MRTPGARGSLWRGHVSEATGSGASSYEVCARRYCSRPDLRIDQIALPRHVADILFDELPEKCRELVLVNRNPTLHRTGLLALRPVIEEDLLDVLGVPLGILGPMGADFDGDQVSVVALETEASLAAARRMLPGSEHLRREPYHTHTPAFPLLHELSDPEPEWSLASEEALTQEEWAVRHFELQQKSIENTSSHVEAFDIDAPGGDEHRWMEDAESEMRGIYLSVREKGRLGGILRRELYRRSCTGLNKFWNAVVALHTVTEPIVQKVLSVKRGAGAHRSLDYNKYFASPDSAASWLETELGLDLASHEIGAALSKPVHPSGLLGWMSQPTGKNLLRHIGDDQESYARGDPRISWYFPGSPVP